jgi:hypothetical protein
VGGVEQRAESVGQGGEKGRKPEGRKVENGHGAKSVGQEEEKARGPEGRKAGRKRRKPEGQKAGKPESRRESCPKKVLELFR